jgi:16S rRNA (guanine966-N2)-methyltransferase
LLHFCYFEDELGRERCNVRVISGEAHGRRISAPRGLATRPATARVRASIFSRLASRFELEGARVLDLFAGSGSLGLEALSRGAAHATFVDSSRTAATAIARNLRATGLDSRARVLALEVKRALSELTAAGERFNLVFVDAPYRNDTSAAVLAILADLRLVTLEGWTVVRQFHRTPALASAGFECVNVANLGDHRIALYRRLEQPPK